MFFRGTSGQTAASPLVDGSQFTPPCQFTFTTFFSAIDHAVYNVINENGSDLMTYLPRHDRTLPIINTPDYHTTNHFGGNLGILYVITCQKAVTICSLFCGRFINTSHFTGESVFLCTVHIATHNPVWYSNQCVFLHYIYIVFKMGCTKQCKGKV